MYVAVKGGEQAIAAAERLLVQERRGPDSVPELSVAQIREQLAHAVHRVMTEGSLYDADIAALAIKQARGDLVEAIHLVRAYRTTLPRLGFTEPLDTTGMSLRRRVSATFKDLPGGQLLGPTFDYTHRLLDFSLMEGEGATGSLGGAAETHAALAPQEAEHPVTSNGNGHAQARVPRVTELLAGEGLIEQERARSHDGARDEDPAPTDLTRAPLQYPADRSARLQNLARGDEGYLLGLGYSTQRGYGRTHPFAGEIRLGEVAVSFVPPELGVPIELGEVTVTECQMINQFAGSREVPPQFTQGYGLTFGHAERKAMAMALVDRALRAGELDEPVDSPAQDAQFVLSHSDNVEASGFVQHLKLPHYVDFQSELELVRRLRADHARRQNAEAADAPDIADEAPNAPSPTETL